MKKMRCVLLFAALAFLLSACGALEPKFYPENRTITSTLFPSDKEDKNDPEFERKIDDLLSGKTAGTTPKTVVKSSLFNEKGKLLVINNLTGVDTALFDEFKADIRKKESNVTDIEVIAVSSLPNLATLRLMGARQQAKFVLILNSFSNVYRYHNAWTIPTIFGLGMPYFFLETQTIKVFTKVEYSLIDIKENVILSNESVTSEAESRAILPESGIVQYRITNGAIAEGAKKLKAKFLERL
jgi:hypothetical protein